MTDFMTDLGIADDALGRLMLASLGHVIGLVIAVALALGLLAVGYFAASLLARSAEFVARKCRFEGELERSRLVRSMRQTGVERSLPSFAGCIVFWLTMWIFTVWGLDLLLSLPAIGGRVAPRVSTGAFSPDLPPVAPIGALGPGLLVAAAMLLAGFWSADLPRRLIAASASRAGWAYARSLSNGCYLVWMTALVVSALELLGLELGLFKNLVLIAFAAATFGLGLAFGLGGRDVTAGILAGNYTRRRLKPGDHVVVAGIEGTIREVGTVATVIETEEDGLMKRRSVPNTVMIAEAVH